MSPYPIFYEKVKAVEFFLRGHNALKQARETLRKRVWNSNEIVEFGYIDGPTSQGTGFYNYHIMTLWWSRATAYNSDIVYTSDIEYFMRGINKFLTHHKAIENLFTRLKIARETDGSDEEIDAICTKLRSYINMRCFEELGVTTSPNFSGLWNLSYGYYIMIEQHGDTFTGKLWNSSGDSWGMIKGKVTNSNIQGEWYRIYKKIGGQPPLPPIIENEKCTFSFTMREDELYFAGELRFENGERVPGHAIREQAWNPRKLLELNDGLLDTEIGDAKYESLLHGWAEDIVKLPRRILNTEEGGPFLQPSKLVPYLEELGEKGVKAAAKAGTNAVMDLVEKESGIEDEKYLSNLSMEQERKLKEGFDATRNTLEEFGQQLTNGVIDAINQKGMKSIPEILNETYRTIEEGIPRESDEDSIPVDTHVEEIEEKDLELNLGLIFTPNIPDFGSKVDLDEYYKNTMKYIDDVEKSKGVSIVKEAGIEFKATFPNDDEASLKIWLENPAILVVPDDNSFENWKAAIGLEVTLKDLGGVKFWTKYSYSEEDQRIEGGIELLLGPEGKDNPFWKRYPDEVESGENNGGGWSKHFQQ